mgnify:CR=1 FL=1
MTLSPNSLAGISRSPKLSNFCVILSKARSTYSVGTGRLCKARVKDRRSFSLSNATRVPLVLITCGIINSAVSYVVKRLSQTPHLRRRRMELPSSLTRESITWVSASPQKGHFIASAAGLRLTSLGRLESARSGREPWL